MSAGPAAHVECNEPDCRKIREERDALLAGILDLSHAQLISRDLELGLRAELTQARIDIEHVRATAAHALVEVRRSRTWRMGAIILSPATLSKRFLRRAKRLGPR